MDQATPADQGVLWNHRECGQPPNLDRHRRLCPDGHVKKRLSLPRSLYTILQILSVTLFEKTPILRVLSHTNSEEPEVDDCIQLNLFD